MRNQIEVMEEEYEQRIADLQTDLNVIRQRLQVSTLVIELWHLVALTLGQFDL